MEVAYSESDLDWACLVVAECISLGQKKAPEGTHSLILHAARMTGHGLVSNHAEKQASNVVSFSKQLYCHFL